MKQSENSTPLPLTNHFLVFTVVQGRRSGGRWGIRVRWYLSSTTAFHRPLCSFLSVKAIPHFTGQKRWANVPTGEVCLCRSSWKSKLEAAEGMSHLCIKTTGPKNLEIYSRVQSLIQSSNLSLLWYIQIMDLTHGIRVLHFQQEVIMALILFF